MSDIRLSDIGSRGNKDQNVSSHFMEETKFTDHPTDFELAVSPANRHSNNNNHHSSDRPPLLYDRKPQEEALHAAYQRSKDNAQVALITGPSGTGKTVLANILGERVEADGGFLFKGKFDQRQYVESRSPVLRAFQPFARRILAHGPQVAQQVKESIRGALNEPEIDILLELIPELMELLALERFQESTSSSLNYYSSSDNNDSEADGSDMDLAEIKHGCVVSIYRRFLQAIVTPERPIVLFLDDLQWADSITLDLMMARLKDPAGTELPVGGFLLLGTCRGNEVSINDGLAVVLRALEDVGTPITDIQVDNLGMDAVEVMVSDLLQLPREECLQLVEIVYKKTSGNPFFVIQYMQSLQQGGILFQSTKVTQNIVNGSSKTMPASKWDWKEEELMNTLMNGNDDDHLITQLLTRKIESLPSDVLQIVKAASCLGADFSYKLLCHSGVLDASQVPGALKVAEEHGLIVYDSNTGSGHFAHDRFQEAAYSLIPDDEKPAFHLNIGRTLRSQLHPLYIKKHFSTILNQIRFGIGLMENDEKEEVAFLCLRASRKAGKRSSFASGSEYAEIGLQLLSNRSWRDQYSLTLDLHNSATELAYCTGKHERVHELVKSILGNARTSDDKLHAHLCKIVSLQAIQQTGAAISYCIEVLRRCGQPFPRTPKKGRILLDLFKTRRKLSQLTDDDIMNLPPLDDPKISSVMVFIHQLFPLVQAEQFEYSPIIAFRLVHLTLKHGLSSISESSTRKRSPYFPFSVFPSQI